jgi:hypothetical protein
MSSFLSNQKRRRKIKRKRVLESETQRRHFLFVAAKSFPFDHCRRPVSKAGRKEAEMEDNKTKNDECRFDRLSQGAFNFCSISFPPLITSDDVLPNKIVRDLLMAGCS